MIFVSAAAGAVLRRGLTHISANPFLQPFGAALLAGVVGGLATRAGLSSSLRLVVVCPCMVLVPGPHSSTPRSIWSPAASISALPVCSTRCWSRWRSRWACCSG